MYLARSYREEAMRRPCMHQERLGVSADPSKAEMQLTDAQRRSISESKIRLPKAASGVQQALAQEVGILSFAPHDALSRPPLPSVALHRGGFGHAQMRSQHSSWNCPRQRQDVLTQVDKQQAHGLVSHVSRPRAKVEISSSFKFAENSLFQLRKQLKRRRPALDFRQGSAHLIRSCNHQYLKIYFWV